MIFEENKEDHMINLLKKGGQFYVVYKESMPQYKYIKREYDLQVAERESKEAICKTCSKPLVEKESEYDCKSCSEHFHKNCLKSCFLNLKATSPFSDKEEFKCPLCRKTIQLKTVMDRGEYKKYKADARTKTSKAKRSRSIHGYLKSSPSIILRAVSKDQKIAALKEEIHSCVLCGESFELHNSIENIFYHNVYDNNCKGGYMHKKCLRKVLNIYFWRKYERYNGISILLLTKTEAQVLGRNWVCPLCDGPLTEAELKMLVDRREWTRQVKMRDERDRVSKSRYNEESRKHIIYVDSKDIM
jgi:hypothetical protein